MWPVCHLAQRLLKSALLELWDNPSGKGSEQKRGMKLKNSLSASLRKTVGQQKAE